MSPSAVARLGRARLVGRQAELQLLAQALADGRQGQPCVALLVGEPGIGKSRVLDEFPPAEQAAGVAILRGGASEAAGMPPYLPFLEALGDALGGQSPEGMLALLGDDAAVLATLLPQVRARLGAALPPPVPILPEQERLRLFDAVASLLVSIARSAPGGLLLVLDDLHWADPATCALLAHVVRRLAAVRAPALVLAACRPAEADHNDPLAALLVELNRRRLLLTVHLGRLDAAGRADLTTALLGERVAGDVLDLVAVQSEGNPFFAEELLRALLEDGALEEHAAEWRLTRPVGAVLPRGIVDAVRQRVRHLPAATVEVLQVAAVVGRTFPVWLVAAVLGRAAEMVEDELRPAVQSRLVLPVAEGEGGWGGGGDYAFVHDKVREALGAEVFGERRRRLHRKVGEALEPPGRAGTLESRRLTDLAYHFVHAGDATRGATYAVAAGEAALGTSAAADAVAHFRAAVDLLGNHGEPPLRARALYRLGEAELQTGAFSQAASAFEAAADAARVAADPVLEGRAWRGLGRARWRQEATHPARVAFEQALAAQGDADHPETAQTLLELADLLSLSLGLPAEGEQRARQALAMVERLGDRGRLALAYLALGSARLRGNRLQEGRDLLEQALMLARSQDDPALAADICGHLASACGYAGDLRRSWEVGVLRESLALRTRDPFHLRHVHLWLAALSVFRGRWATATEMARRAEAAVALVDSPEPRSFLCIARGFHLYYTGRFEAALESFRRALHLMDDAGQPPAVWHHGWAAQAAAEMGNSAAAEADLARLGAVAERTDEHDTMRGHAYTHLVLGYTRLERWPSAAACYPKLRPFAGQMQGFSIDRALGLAAWAGGDHLAAQRHLADAEALGRREDLLPDLALTLVLRGVLEARSGRLAEGHRLAALLGMQALAGATEATARKLAERRAARPTWPAGLSGREVEVLRMVARGCSNRQIADRLVLSEKTVANHLTAIFSKARVENRAAATAFAFAHGLATASPGDASEGAP